MAAGDFEALAAAIRWVFPEAHLEPATEEQLATIRRNYPDAPNHYTEFLRRIGWGSLSGTFMLYDGLVGSHEIFDADTAAELVGIAFLGDNFSGCVIGFDTQAGWRLVAVDDGSAPEPLPQRTLVEFIEQRIADNREDP